MADKYQVPFDGSFNIVNAASSPELTADQDKNYFKEKLKKEVKKISKLQELLYAHDKYSVLLIFQAMDAAGKDSTIRAVMSGINPAGCQVSAFKKPSSEELDHDFLWRVGKRLPERGRIGVFNRSHYEEVLVLRVHPEYLKSARLPGVTPEPELWQQRYESIRNFEQHLHRNGTIILKFFLNVSLDEQRLRFLSRLNDPEKFWKFSSGDLDERACWGEYMTAYQIALNETSCEQAPWYAIPADNKPYMRYRVAKTIRRALEELDMHYPEVSEAEILKHDEFKNFLRTKS